MWNVPIDHEYFGNINTVQWLWYYFQDMKDQEEEHIQNRDMLEYHATFLAPEVVSKVLERRGASISGSGSVVGTKDDAAFNESVKRMFGTDPGLSVRQDGEAVQVDGLFEKIAEYERTQAVKLQTETPYNYKYWTNLNLE